MPRVYKREPDRLTDLVSTHLSAKDKKMLVKMSKKQGVSLSCLIREILCACLASAEDK